MNSLPGLCCLYHTCLPCYKKSTERQITMILYLFWMLLLFLLVFIVYHLIPALHIYVTDTNLKYIRRYRGFVDDEMFHVPPDLRSEEFDQFIKSDERVVRGCEVWGGPNRDGPCKSMPDNCYWYKSMLYCRSHLLR
jgi:hypothetical protein